MEDALPPSTATATAVTAQTMVSSAATTVVSTIGRIGSRNGTHRTVNVHGRLMYDEIVLNDVWINAILSTLAFTCAACLCVCFLYCKFQQWKHAGKLSGGTRGFENALGPLQIVYLRHTRYTLQMFSNSPHDVLCHKYALFFSNSLSVQYFYSIFFRY